MTLKLISGPATEPLTPGEAKAHLRIDFSEDDTYIGGLISAAREYAEGIQKRSLATQTLELSLDQFPTKISLERGPVQSVTSVIYTKADGSQTTMQTSDYVVTTDEKVIPTTAWPGDSLAPADGVRVRYVAGYETIPATTKQALLMLVAHWYENRESVAIGRDKVNEMPMGVNSLLWLNRWW